MACPASFAAYQPGSGRKGCSGCAGSNRPRAGGPPTTRVARAPRTRTEAPPVPSRCRRPRRLPGTAESMWDSENISSAQSMVLGVVDQRRRPLARVTRSKAALPGSRLRSMATSQRVTAGEVKNAVGSRVSSFPNETIGLCRLTSQRTGLLPLAGTAPWRVPTTAAVSTVLPTTDWTSGWEAAWRPLPDPPAPRACVSRPGRPPRQPAWRRMWTRRGRSPA